jgi:acyl-CoA synthetase (AMP-forming)/AMP-acid ligase II
LIEHVDVTDIAVFGVPDPEWGHKIVAVIQKPEGGEVDLDSVREFAKQRLASYKIPRLFDVVDELPREAHGKLKKHLLRDRYSEGAER